MRRGPSWRLLETEGIARVLSSSRRQITKQTKDIYEGRDPRTLAAYPIVEASHYLGLKTSTLGGWLRRGVIARNDVEDEQMSFWALVEAFVLKGLREDHQLSLQR